MKKSLIIIGSLVAIALAVYGIAELQYQSNISAMIQAVTQTKKDVLEPSQGVETAPPAVTHGNSLFNGWFCVDTNCPQVESKWKILVTDGKYDELRSQLTTQIKQADKSNKWRVSIFSEDVKIEDYPFPAPTGKAWTELRIFVYQ